MHVRNVSFMEMPQLIFLLDFGAVVRLFPFGGNYKAIIIDYILWFLCARVYSWRSGDSSEKLWRIKMMVRKPYGDKNSFLRWERFD